MAMYKSGKISLPISQYGKNTEGSLGYCADMRGIRASSISYGKNPGQTKVLPGSQLCSGEGKSESIILVLEGGFLF